MTRTHQMFSAELRRMGVKHRNEAYFRAPKWEHGYRADIYLPQYRTLIEVDGPSHLGRVARDRTRDRRFHEDLGISTIRIRHAECDRKLCGTLRQAIAKLNASENEEDR